MCPMSNQATRRKGKPQATPRHRTGAAGTKATEMMSRFPSAKGARRGDLWKLLLPLLPLSPFRSGRRRCRKGVEQVAEDTEPGTLLCRQGSNSSNLWTSAKSFTCSSSCNSPSNFFVCSSSSFQWRLRWTLQKRSVRFQLRNTSIGLTLQSTTSSCTAGCALLFEMCLRGWESNTGSVIKVHQSCKQHSQRSGPLCWLQQNFFVLLVHLSLTDMKRVTVLVTVERSPLDIRLYRGPISANGICGHRCLREDTTSRC